MAMEEVCWSLKTKPRLKHRQGKNKTGEGKNQINIPSKKQGREEQYKLRSKETHPARTKTLLTEDTRSVETKTEKSQSVLGSNFNITKEKT